RKVFRVAGVYVIVAWLIIQIGEATFEALNLPSWALTLIIVLLFTGFPIAIIFAWIFDKTPEGIVRSSKVSKDTVSKKPVVSNAIIAVLILIIIGMYLYPKVFNEDQAIATKLQEKQNAKSIAVLPFTPFTLSEENQSFADGVHDDILTQLSKIHDLKVISRTSVMEYKKTTKKIKQIAQELSVQHVLEGSVRRAGDQIRIVAQLIDANTDNHIWSETYDREYKDIFTIQSDVAKNIADALKATLTPEEIDYIDEIPTENLEAYDYFLKGMHFWNTSLNKAGYQKAVDMFDKATELDPDFALAYANASMIHTYLYIFTTWDHSPERKELAKNALEQAIAIDPDHPRVHYAKGSYQFWCLYDVNAALSEYEIALKGEPNSADIVSSIGWAHYKLGNWERVEENFLKVVELDPLSVIGTRNVAYFYRDQRQFHKADNYFNLAIQLDPELARLYRERAFNYLTGFGDIDQARSLLQEAEISVKDPEALLPARYYIELYARDLSKALSYAKDSKENDPGSVSLGEAYHLLKEKELAQAEFESMRSYYENKVIEEPDFPS
ncbi:MAG: hypothetical protein IMF01_05090, partial [Proteobacteria bacterium]|nr:hypothetical protein [Pseudomonadota bacterium]